MFPNTPPLQYPDHKLEAKLTLHCFLHGSQWAHLLRELYAALCATLCATNVISQLD